MRANVFGYQRGPLATNAGHSWTHLLFCCRRFVLRVSTLLALITTPINLLLTPTKTQQHAATIVFECPPPTAANTHTPEHRSVATTNSADPITTQHYNHLQCFSAAAAGSSSCAVSRQPRAGNSCACWQQRQLAEQQRALVPSRSSRSRRAQLRAAHAAAARPTR